MKAGIKYGKISIIVFFIIGAILVVSGFIKSNYSSDITPKANETSQSELTEMLGKINGIGKLQLMISTEGKGEGYRITGVAIICEGGNDPRVQKDIIGIVGALWGVPSNRIYVTSMNTK